jgi:hypothetical protein
MRAKLLAILDFTLASCAALLICASHAQTALAQSTQTQSPRAGQSQAQQPEAEPDLSITARVTADSLRFEKVPNPRVEFTGQPRRETVWKSERENLPEQVQPGVTYRNIGITLRITSVFADIDRIVAEALGEVPSGDDAQPQVPPPTRPLAQNETQPPPNSAPQEPTRAQTSSPAKAHARTAARARAARRGRGM